MEVETTSDRRIMESYSEAIRDFRRARSRAALQQLLARLTGKPSELLSYEDVRRAVRASGIVSHSLRDIPLDAIAGSVGRYNDFNRSFLPLQDSDVERWARVKVAVNDLSGLPPVEVYQIGDAYFVHDGHHRVSVAREQGAETVQAYVTEIRSKVPFSPDMTPEDLILQAEHVDFLEQTRLDRLRPNADLSVSCPGQYETLLEHIEVHRHYMGIEQQREIPYKEAAEHWYDSVYLPVIQIVRELGIMREFPNRTETDLYLWISRHRAALEEALGWEIPTSSAAVDLADQHSPKLSRVAARIGRRVVDVVLPDSLDPGPPSGMWRRERMADRPDDRLFVDILVTIPGDEMAWQAMEQAIILAQHEGSRILGLHVVETEEDLQSAALSALSDRFYWRCGEVGIVGKFVAEAGSVSRRVCDRARWADIVVASLAYPPEENPVSRLSSGFRKLIKCSSRPILTVPGATSGLTRPLLAYDGQPKAREALLVAAYLAGRWDLPLIVVTVDDDGDSAAQTIDEAREYLDSHGVDATYLTTAGTVSEAILTAARENGCDWLVVGGYGGNPLLEAVKGGVLNEMLNDAHMPILIAQ